MLKPNTYYLVGPEGRPKARYMVILVTDETGFNERDLYYRNRGKWKPEEDSNLWLDVEEEMCGLEVRQQWSSKEDMLADMFLELM